MGIWSTHNQIIQAIAVDIVADANNPTGGFVINGEIKYDYSGFSVSNAGDVNGDGLAVWMGIWSTHNQIIQAIAVDIACTGDRPATIILCRLAINNKSPCRVAYISNHTQINGTIVGFTNGNAIDLSTIADANNPTGGFVINGEIKYDYSGFSVSNAGDVNGDGLDDFMEHPQSNHPSHRR
jgi:hypothetical protein